MVPLSLILIDSWLGFQGRDISGERLDRQRVRGPSRSLKMSPFDRAPMTSC